MAASYRGIDPWSKPRAMETSLHTGLSTKSSLLGAGNFSSSGALTSTSRHPHSLLNPRGSTLTSSLFSSSLTTRPDSAQKNLFLTDDAKLLKYRKELAELERSRKSDKDEKNKKLYEVHLGGLQLPTPSLELKLSVNTRAPSSMLQSSLLVSNHIPATSHLPSGVRTSHLSTAGKLGLGTSKLSNPLLRSTTVISKKPVAAPKKSSVASQKRVQPQRAVPKKKVSRPKVAPAQQKKRPTVDEAQLEHQEKFEFEEKEDFFKRDDIELPEYCLELPGGDEDQGLQVAKFVALEAKSSLGLGEHVKKLKLGLINEVARSLIRAPNFKDKEDDMRFSLIHYASNLAFYDPEFVLKVALYTRNELNIRVTANFMLAFAASSDVCRPYLRRYFSASIRLPSDWIDVAELYQVFDDSSLTFGSLPAALRKVMINKFPDFDKYQLGKYNKDSAGRKKKKKEKKEEARAGRGRGGFRGRGRGRGAQRSPFENQSDNSDSESEDEGQRQQEGPISVDRLMKLSSIENDKSESEEEVERKTFTLKQLIRKLHIMEPVEHVMCLIGKRYPESLEDFYKSRLPGTWEEERAGKRMKLPTPETWETQVSLKGNKASTWEDLLDHKKLPFMAMLRNLRNMIKAGISDKHHQWVLRKLTDKGAVINSRQFPFRFFSAYQVLTQLEKEYFKNQSDIVEVAVEADTRKKLYPGRGGRGRGGRGRGGRGRGGKSSSKPLDEVPFDEALLARYRKALDTAVKIATTHNITPIRGRTIVLVNLGPEMEAPCSSARGLGPPRKLCEVAALLGLMCKYSCEECRMIVYGNNRFMPGNLSVYQEVELEKGTILDNMDSVIKLMPLLNISKPLPASAPMDILMKLVFERTQVDNLILLSTGFTDNQSEEDEMMQFLMRYRSQVNPNLLFASVNLSGKVVGTSGLKHQALHHENDVHIAGFSDQILRFIAERGQAGQLVHVEKIDEAYQLKPMPLPPGETWRSPQNFSPEQPLPLRDLTPRWRTARVFISSTFRDMHGERDLLTRFVFPELRARAEKHFVNVYEVDLRWGVTEAETRSNKALELCLSEVARSQLFVGILGERYGWVPSEYNVPTTPEFDWLREYPSGASVTELEMHLAALARPSEAQHRAFFYFRDTIFESAIPKRWRDDFVSEDSESYKKMKALKGRILKSGLEVMNGYPCQWGGVVNGIQPVVTGLDQFGFRVLNNLWHGIQKAFPDENAVLDEKAHITSLHEAFIASRHERFIGRQNLMKQCMKKLVGLKNGLLMLVGKAGTGKTALMASLISKYVESKECVSGLNVMTHFVGAAPGSTNIVATLQRLCHEMNRRFSLNTVVPEDFKNLVPKFSSILKDVATQTSSPFVMFIEALNLLQDVHQAQNMDWLPNPIPDNCVIVVSVTEGTDPHRALLRRRPDQTIIGNLDLLDKAEVVRHQLAAHGKQLDETPFNNQMKMLTSKKEATIPLYLSLACEELRVFGVYEKMTEKLQSLPQTVPTLLQEIMERLEEDHDPSMVATTLALLVCARNDLREEELHHLLSIYANLPNKTNIDIKDVVMPDHLLPSAVFTRLVRGIRCFLRPTDATSEGQLSLGHADIEEAIRKRYMKSSVLTQEADYHRLLAGYYLGCTDTARDGSWAGTNGRSFTELPWHLARGGCYKQLEEMLCSLDFIAASCRLGLAAELLGNYHIKGWTRMTQSDLDKLRVKERVQAYLTFVSRNNHILSSHPALIYQQAVNEPSNAVLTQDAEDLINNGCLTSDGLIRWRNRPHSADPCLLTLAGLTQVVTCVAMAADQTEFACGMKDGTAHLYNMATGKERLVFTGHSNKINSICFAGAERLCTASADRTLSLWSSRDGHRVAVMKGHTRPVSACRSQPNGKMIASTGWDCQLRLWDTQTGQQVTGDLKSDTCPVNCVAFHPEGGLIVTGSWDATLKIYDVFHKTRKAILRGHLTSVRDVAYSPSGRHIASASLDGEVKLWSAAQGTQVGSLHGHCLPVNQLTFSPSGNELVTVSDDQKVKVWSGHLGQPAGEFSTTGGAAACSVSLHPRENHVAVGYHDGYLRVFSTVSGTAEYSVKLGEKRLNCVKYTSTDGNIIVGSDDGQLQVINGAKGTIKFKLMGHTKGVTAIAMTTWGNKVASASHDFTTCVHALPASRQDKATQEHGPIMTLTGHTAPVTGCAFNGNGNKLATCSRDKSVMIWSMNSSKAGPQKPEQVIHACHADWINCLAWSNRGDFIVTGSNDFNLKLWDVNTGKEKLTMAGHMSAVTDVNYQYGCIVSTCMDGAVKVWSHKGLEITTLYGHSQAVNACDMKITIQVKKDQDGEEETGGAASWVDLMEKEEWKEKHDQAKLEKSMTRVDDTLVATVSEDGTLRLWRPMEGNELTSLIGHSDRVTSVACSANGTVCTSSLDNSVKLWKPQLEGDGQTTAHDADVTSVAISPDGTYIVTASRDGTIKLWSAPVGGDEETSSVPVIQASVKTGTSVNCVCFMNGKKSEVQFATGSNDGTIETWYIVCTQGRVSLREGFRDVHLPLYVRRPPVTSLMWSRVPLDKKKSHVSSAATQGFLIATAWSSDIFCFTVSQTGMTCTVVKNRGHPEPVLLSALLGKNCVTVSDRTIGTWREMHESLEWMVKPVEIEMGPRKSDWITALSLGHVVTWLGDSEGQLTCCTNETSKMQTWLAHESRITGVEVEDQFVFTASADMTVKVWKTKHDSDIQQVGQFFLAAPATCLALNPDPHRYLLTCGDQLGNVAFLEWKV